MHDLLIKRKVRSLCITDADWAPQLIVE
jgi:hypothetical protein